jgi:predicted dehydrogenase
MRFSRDWPRPCEIQIQCTRGILIWNLDDPDRVAVGFGGSRLWLSETESAGFDECFARQLDAALAGTPRVSAEQSLASVDLIASAYAARRSIDMPWMEPLDGP